MKIQPKIMVRDVGHPDYEIQLELDFLYVPPQQISKRVTFNLEGKEFAFYNMEDVFTIHGITRYVYFR